MPPKHGTGSKSKKKPGKKYLATSNSRGELKKARGKKWVEFNLGKGKDVFGMSQKTSAKTTQRGLKGNWGEVKYEPSAPSRAGKGYYKKPRVVNG